jgi:hypothetical protein
MTTIALPEGLTGSEVRDIVIAAIREEERIVRASELEEREAAVARGRREAASVTAAMDAARLQLIVELHEAIYGSSWARSDSPAAVWTMLLVKVRGRFVDSPERLHGEQLQRETAALLATTQPPTEPTGDPK